MDLTDILNQLYEAALEHETLSALTEDAAELVQRLESIMTPDEKVCLLEMERDRIASALRDSSLWRLFPPSCDRENYLSQFITILKPVYLAPDESQLGSFQRETSEAYTTVPVFYATDRSRTGEEAPHRFYSGYRGNLEFGVARVAIPKDHRMGKLEQPRWWKLEFQYDPTKHVTVLSLEPLEHGDFLGKVRQAVGEATRPEVLVFVHGYNVSFASALQRTAQLCYDLNFQGVGVTYSWPSEGKVTSYTIDESNIQWTETHFANIVESICREVGAEIVHLVAHSMGSRALLRKLDAFSRKSLAGSEAAISEVILAAPDFDADILRELAARIIHIPERITLYASSNDRALKASEILHGYPRAGQSGDCLVLVEGIETIDASDVDTSLLGHSYYGERRSIIADMFMVLLDGQPPQYRFGLEQRKQRELPYWYFRP